MAEAQKKIYAGSGKKRGDKWLSVTLDYDKLGEHTFEYQGKRHVKVNININDQPNQYGKDVSVTVDTWKPDPSKSQNAAAPQAATESDGLPF